MSRFILSAACALSLIGPAAFAQTSTDNSMSPGMSKSPAMSNGSAMGTPATRPDKEQGANAVGTGGSASDNNAMSAPANGGAGMNAPGNGMSKSTGSGMSQ